MSHYDYSYNHDRTESIERYNKETKERLINLIEELSPEDIHFLISICDEIEDVKAHFRIIGKNFNS